MLIQNAWSHSLIFAAHIHMKSYLSSDIQTFFILIHTQNVFELNLLKHAHRVGSKVYIKPKCSAA